MDGWMDLILFSFARLLHRPVCKASGYIKYYSFKWYISYINKDKLNTFSRLLTNCFVVFSYLLITVDMQNFTSITTQTFWLLWYCTGWDCPVFRESWPVLLSSSQHTWVGQSQFYSSWLHDSSVLCAKIQQKPRLSRVHSFWTVYLSCEPYIINWKSYSGAENKRFIEVRFKL